MSYTGKIRILIADDFKELRDLIRLHLERAGDMEVIDEAPDLDDAMLSARKNQPDVIIVNDYLPPMNSALAAALFRKQGISSAILVVSESIAIDHVQLSFHYGVRGYMHKEEIEEQLVEAVRHIRRGELYFSTKVREVYGTTPPS